MSEQGKARDKEAFVGRRFGDLIVISEDELDSRGYPKWKCLCDCGNTKVVSSSNLVSGNTRSCGCRRTTKGGRKAYKKTPKYPQETKVLYWDPRNKKDFIPT